jgi:hypothetical protein
MNGIDRRRLLTTEELVERHRRLPLVDLQRMRDEADDHFGAPDRIDDEDAPGDRPPGGMITE